MVIYSLTKIEWNKEAILFLKNRIVFHAIVLVYV